MKVCLICGHGCKDNSLFCSNCGSGLPASPIQKKPSLFLTIGKIALYIALFFVVQTAVSLAVGLIVGVAVALSNPTSSPEMLTDATTKYMMEALPIISLISNLVYVAGISLFFVIRRKNAAKEAGIGKFSWWMIPLCAVFGYCINPVISFISALIPWPRFLVEYFNSGTEDLVSGNLVLTIVSISIITGIVEEYLFRGIVMTRLSRICGTVANVMISALIFAIVHLNPISFLGIFILAVFLGFLFKRSGSIVPGMIVHAFFNLFAIIGYPSENTVFILGFISVCAGFALGSGYLLLCRRKEVQNVVSNKPDTEEIASDNKNSRI